MSSATGGTAASDEIAFDWNALTLVGTLHRPVTEMSGTGAPPGPTVLMLQGSGPADRTSGGYFDPIRSAFLDRGIATFAFDKPGCGSSSGDWRRYGLEARAEQATAAIRALRNRSDVDADRVGIFGHSQGGWLVQILAGGTVPLSFAIASAAPSIGVAAQDLYGHEHTLRGRGLAEADISRAVAFVGAVHDAARRGDDFPTVEEQIVAPAKHEPWYDYLTIDDADDWAMVRIWATEPHDPIECLRRVRCPFLAVYGALDQLLPPWRSAEETAAALLEAGIDDSAVVVVPAGNHRIQHGPTDEFVPGYLDLVGDWAARHT